MRGKRETEDRKQEEMELGEGKINLKDTDTANYMSRTTSSLKNYFEIFSSNMQKSLQQQTSSF